MKSFATFQKFSKLLIEQSGGHFEAIGMKIKAIEHGNVSLLLPYSDRIVGNPDEGVVHGGCLTALLDTCCAFTATSILDELCFCPTIDLRIDYINNAQANKTITASSKIIRMTPHVIFVKGVAYQDDPSNPVAYCSANYLRVEPSVALMMKQQIETMLRDAEQ